MISEKKPGTPQELMLEKHGVLGKRVKHGKGNSLSEGATQLRAGEKFLQERLALGKK